MPEDPSSQPTSDPNTSPSSELQNRPEPVAKTPVSASESASSQTEQPQTAESEASPPLASESAGTQPEIPPAPDQPSDSVPPQAQEPPLGEAVSISTSPQAELSGTTPPAQEVLPKTEPVREESQSVQAATEPQSQPEPEAPQPQNQEVTLPPAAEPAPTSSTPPTPPIPSLHYPFYGNHPVTFDFGAQPTDEKVKKKYEEWGIVGHNGIDFGLQEGTEVLACDQGVVIQAGDNGDHGISVTIKHSWGTSIYSHLQSFGVLINDHVTKAQVIGSSDQTGFTAGPHLHFGIQLINPDTNNGYLGYIDPTPYLTEISPLPQSPLPAEASAKEVVSLPSPQLPDLSVPTPISPQSPVSPQSPQSPDSLSEAPLPSSPPNPPNPSYPPLASPIADQEEIQKQAVAMFDARLKENSIKGNQAKKAKRDEAIQKIFTFAQEKKRVTNEQIRDLLHVSQSTATDYLSQLVSRGMLKTEGKGKATVYIF